MTATFQVATLAATLERITYANEDTGYMVAKVDIGRGGELVTVVGSLLGARPGEALRLRGRWGSDPQYGRQFQVEDFTTVLPATVQGVRRYLGSGLIKGIGRSWRAPRPDQPAKIDTVYEGPQCQTRHLGTQRCDDCNTWCRRLGPGGCPCPPMR